MTPWRHGWPQLPEYQPQGQEAGLLPELGPVLPVELETGSRGQDPMVSDQEGDSEIIQPIA